ncbi:hypothetical protein OPV22_015825 [Ensete ventricosum]|uniref:Uncharacterized protein n=1 Tax=Ensete ventricosum TaxID=4639 RepID=A0AAV8PTX5_ENSVE|nr:hypothetical protein OPV22_015825 [Ensete ventricosum]
MERCVSFFSCYNWEDVIFESESKWDNTRKDLFSNIKYVFVKMNKHIKAGVGICLLLLGEKLVLMQQRHSYLLA